MLNPSPLNLSYCLGGDNIVVLGGLNITNGMREYYVYYTYNFPMNEITICLFITTIVLLIYGERIKSFVRSLRSKNRRREILQKSPFDYD
jgi:hypothetical protein